MNMRGALGQFTEGRSNLTFLETPFTLTLLELVLASRSVGRSVGQSVYRDTQIGTRTYNLTWKEN
jgi:hypothetical protein